MTPVYMAPLLAAFGQLTAFLPEHRRYGVAATSERPAAEPAVVTVERYLKRR